MIMQIASDCVCEMCTGTGFKLCVCEMCTGTGFKLCVCVCVCVYVCSLPLMSWNMPISYDGFLNGGRCPGGNDHFILVETADNGHSTFGRLWDFWEISNFAIARSI